MSIFGGYGGVRGYKSFEGNYATRAYVDAVASRRSSPPDLSQYLKKTVDGNVDLEGGRLMNVGESTANTDGVSVKMVKDGWELLKGEVVRKNGATPMEGHLDLGGHRIMNVGLPWRSNDGVNRDYVDARLGQIQIPDPVITLVAEERGSLIGGEFEWSFGSNSEGRSQGKVGYVMMKKGKILSMSLSAAERNGLSEDLVSVGVTLNGQFQQGYDITKARRSYSANKTFQTPLEVEKGDIINFQTRDTSRSHASGVVALLIELKM